MEKKKSKIIIKVHNYEDYCTPLPMLELIIIIVCTVVLYRALFADAELEQKKMGINSALHIIILDELDSICRRRGSLVSSSIYNICDCLVTFCYSEWQYWC